MCVCARYVATRSLHWSYSHFFMFSPTFVILLQSVCVPLSTTPSSHRTRYFCGGSSSSMSMIFRKVRMMLPVCSDGFFHFFFPQFQQNLTLCVLIMITFGWCDMVLFDPNLECARVSMNKRIRLDELGHRYNRTRKNRFICHHRRRLQQAWPFIGDNLFTIQKRIGAHLHANISPNLYPFDCIEHVLSFTFISDQKTDRMRELIEQHFSDNNLHHVFFVLRK